jgi:hypothetical protein
MLRNVTICAALLAAGATSAAADDVTDSIQSALDAYTQGDIQYAIEELAFATQLLKGMKAGTLSGFLPEAMDGWTREVDEEESRSMAIMGGTAAVGHYTRGPDSFTISILADNPMLAGFAGIMGNPAMMASMGKIERVGREKFLNQDGDLSGVIGSRVLVQASGADIDVMIDHLKTMNFRDLQNFGT